MRTPTGHIVSRTGSWCAPRFSVSGFRGSAASRSAAYPAAVFLTIAAAACSEERRSGNGDTTTTGATLEQIDDGRVADTLPTVCPRTARRGSVLVARPDPKEEESQISFKLLGDGAGPGVVLCRDTLYADVNALLGLMGESAKVTWRDGRAAFDGAVTGIPAYSHEGVLYVAVAPFARHRQALLMPSDDHPMDATLWPRKTLLFMKTLGATRRGLYDSAVRAGLLPP